MGVCALLGAQPYQVVPPNNRYLERTRHLHRSGPVWEPRRSSGLLGLMRIVGCVLGTANVG